MVSEVNPTGNADIDGLLWGWKWDSTNITFSFPTSTVEYIAPYTGYSIIDGFQVFNAAQQAAVRTILGNVANFTNLDFTETTAAGAELRYAEADQLDLYWTVLPIGPPIPNPAGLHDVDPAEGIPPELAFVLDPGLPSHAQGDSWYNHTNYNDPLVGSFAYASGLMHETGHTLGLKHGHELGYAHGTFFPELPSDHDSFEYSVMTYSQFPGDATDNGDNAPDHPTTYMQDDILALQYMYGANYSFNSGNNVYTWSPATGQSFVDGVGGLTPDSNFILMTVWDGGGTDTYDFSNYTTNLEVHLSPGGWTTVSDAQLADLGDNGAGGANYIARGNIANAQTDPNDPAETASLIENATGGTGSDEINGNALNNTLTGGFGEDDLFGLDGDDVLEGDENDDVLKGGGGADTLDGGGGIDTADYFYSYSEEGVTVNLEDGTGSGGDAEGDTLSSIENISGSFHDDALTGDIYANTLKGDGGNDVVKGGGGADALDGGSGIDTASYLLSPFGVTVGLAVEVNFGGDAQGDVLTNIENVYGSEYYDQLTGDDDDNFLYGWHGDDTLRGGGGADELDGGNGIDIASYDLAEEGVSVSLEEGAGYSGEADGDTLVSIENIVGSAYDDGLTGDGQSNVIDAGSGDDIVKGGGGADELDGGDDIDTLSYYSSLFGVSVDMASGMGSGGDANGDELANFENVAGSNFADTLSGDSGANGLYGYDGDDWLDGGAGADVMEGGADDDIYHVDNIADKVTELAGEGDFDLVYASIHAILPANVEILSLTGTANLSGTGNSLDNTLLGNTGNNLLTGATGDDAFEGSSGADILWGGQGGDDMGGGPGSDTAIYTGSDAGVHADLGANLNFGGHATGDTFSSIENLWGSSFDDVLVGYTGANYLNGGAGADTMGGYTGNDTYVVDNGLDIVIEVVSGGTDTVRTTLTSYTLGPDVERLVLLNALATSGVGNTLANTITGAGNGESLQGLAGIDSLFGNGGNDTLRGGTEADALDGGEGTDTASYASAAAAVNVALDGGFAATGEALGDTFTGIEYLQGSNAAAGDSLRGDTLANSLFGFNGDDTLRGLDGADQFIGAAGADTLQGDLGNDKFNYYAAGEGGDILVDFANAANNDDTFQFLGSAFGGLPQGVLAATRFVIRAADNLAQDADDNFIFQTNTRQLWFDATGNAAAGDAVLIATLQAGAAMTNADVTIF